MTDVLPGFNCRIDAQLESVKDWGGGDGCEGSTSSFGGREEVMTTRFYVRS